ncbi:hypothetical protein [Amycolatopsis solani]|uniref:hypothetical protein n=1 Tax=Amycolatopsis solani TaxID=3028615 RepID=UPI0025B17A12|nr:hypothetical protein [Amycolatopsis sp. MEP2-6]
MRGGAGQDAPSHDPDVGAVQGEDEHELPPVVPAQDAPLGQVGQELDDVAFDFGRVVALPVQ